jgi:type IV secretory pathway VirJ component
LFNKVVFVEKSQHQFSFPQANGDVFAFDGKVNQAFEHGVPREKMRVVGPRFSIICWGRRRTLNVRNAGSDDIASNPQRALRSSKDRGSLSSSANAADDESSSSSSEQEQAANGENEPTMTGNEVAHLVNEFVRKQKQEQERRAAKEAKKVAVNNPPTTTTTTTATTTQVASNSSANGNTTPTTTSNTIPAAPKSHVKPKSRVQGGWNNKR